MVSLTLTVSTQALLVRKRFFVLGERLVDSFGRPNEGDHPEQVRGGQHHRRQPKARDGGQALQRVGERSKDEHAKGCDVAADIVAKARASGAQSCREEFGEIDGVAAERREGAKTEDRPQIPDLVRFMKSGKCQEKAAPGEEQRDQERGPAAKSR